VYGTVCVQPVECWRGIETVIEIFHKVNSESTCTNTFLNRDFFDSLETLSAVELQSWVSF
jgi:hypothetical protein